MNHLGSPPPPPGGDPRYGLSGRPPVAGAPGGEPGAPSSPPLDPLSNRLLWLAGFLGVLLIAVVVNSVLNGEGGLNPVAQAAERTAHLPGGKIAMEVSYSAPGLQTPVVGSGSGSFDTRSGRSQVEFTVQGPGGSETITSVADARTSYLRSPSISAELPPGHAWLAMQPFLGHDPETAFGTSSGPKSTLEMLSTVGEDVQKMDQQTVRGHLTTRYKATLDLRRMSSVLQQNGETELAQEYEQLATKMPSSTPVEVWIDPAGVARRVRIVQELPTGVDGVTVTADTRMEIFDFGPQPKIALPPDHAVLDITPLLRAELGLLNGSRYAKLIAPTQAKTLSRAAFRRRGNEICRSFKHRGSSFEEATDSLKRELENAGGKQEAQAIFRRWDAELVAPIERLGRKFTRRLAKIAPPGAEAAAYREALGNVAVTLERLEALGVALQAGSVPEMKKLSEEEKSNDAAERSLFGRVGLGACVSKPGEGSQAGQSDASIE